MQQTHTDVPQHCLRPQDPGHSGGLLMVILLGLGLSIAAGLMSGQVMMRSPASIAPAPLATMAQGSRVDLVVQVSAVDGERLQVRVLERRGDSYVPGSASLHVALTPATRFAMGRRADLKPGAVLQLRGTMEDAGSSNLRATRAVILTGYVQVGAGRP